MTALISIIMKKILKILLLTLFITIFSINTIYADDTVYTDGALQYTIDENGCIRIVYYFGDSPVVEIPRAIGLYEKNGDFFPCYVTSIAATIFEDAEVTEVKLPDTVVFIEEGAIDSSIKLIYYDSYGNAIDKQDEPEPIIITPQEPVVVHGDEVIEQGDSSFEEIDIDEIEEILEEDPTSTPEQSVDEVIDKDDSGEEIVAETKPTNEQTDVVINPVGYVVIGLVIIGTVITTVKIRKKRKA